MKRELPVLIAFVVLVALCYSVWPGANEDEPRAPHAAPVESAPSAPEVEIVATRCALRLIPGRIPFLIVDWRARVFAKHPSS